MKRYKAWPLGALVTLLATCWVTGCGGDDDERPSGPTLYELRVRPFEEHTLPILGRAEPSLRDVVVDLTERLDQPQTRGLLLRLQPLGGHWAHVHELRSLIAAYQKADRPVHCHFDQLDNAGYAVAAGCDRLTMTPSGMLNLVGLGMQVLHGKELLESIGVQAQLYQVGRYKGAAEPVTRNTMSEPLRESLDRLLNDLDQSFREAMASRKALRDAPGAHIDAGPYGGGRAREAGLVDELSYDDAARAVAKEASGAEHVQRLFDPEQREKPSLGKLLEAFAGESEKDYEGKARLAVVYLRGQILDGEEQGMERTFSGPFVRAVRRLADEADVRAVVLRIDSPGGSAMASDRMWHAVRRLAKRKPVIVSIGTMAASGGYYVAAAGDEILAAPTSLVGSIGVVGGKVTVDDLASRAGVHTDVLERGEHATWLSPLVPFSDEEQKLLEGFLHRTYARFLDRVARGRDMSEQQLEPAAQGRLLSGTRGQQLGLVDRTGTLADALQTAREAGGLDADAPLQVWPDQRDPLAALSQMLGGARSRTPEAKAIEAVTEALKPAFRSPLYGTLVESREPVALALPHMVWLR